MTAAWQGSRARVRARYAALPAATGRTGAQGPLGAVVRELRAERGLTVAALARRAALDRRTVQRLERGQLRPRYATLWTIAYAVDPDEVDELARRLVAAAVPDIAPDTAEWLAYRRRRLWAAWTAGEIPLPTYWERSARLHTASAVMLAASRALRDRAIGMLGTPGEHAPWADEPIRDALRAESALLASEGGRRVDKGLPPRRRFRGDPADVPPYPPAGADLRALRRWLREWQVRQGRRPPRTARERAIAQTGARERDKVKAHPEPVTRPPVITRIRWLPDWGAYSEMPRQREG